MVRTNVLSALMALAFCTSLNPAPAYADGVTTATLRDPALQMTAGTLQIPAGWKFQGAMLAGSGCDPFPSPVFRAYSPDGLSEMRGAPPFKWSFTSVHFPQKCPSLTQAMDATEFLKYYRGIARVTYVGPMSVDPIVQQRLAASIAQANQNPAHTHVVGDVVAQRVAAKNGSFDIEEQLRANVRCSTTPLPGSATVTTCVARLLTIRAPKGRLNALVAEIDANHLPHVVFSQAYQQQISQQADALFAGQRATGYAEMDASARRLRAAYEQSTAILEHQHEQFMAQMNSSFQHSMNDANAQMNARSTIASDWTDYALDRQTVTGSGGTVKVSNAYGNTWSNGQGEWYQTNDPNADPNGVLQGNWTQQTVVHGNGTPK